ncbi:MAG: hypothetical protein NZ580_00445 [Bacteroidia bacterium]|nr:hypothetical protein [Bacteroidia bacterium]MDW8235007.1 hypothetical protein [Bacteroidia bacterium]
MAQRLSPLRLSLALLAWRLLLGTGLRRQRLIFSIQIGAIAIGSGGALLVLVLFDSFQHAIQHSLTQYSGAIWIRYYAEERLSQLQPIEKDWLHRLSSSQWRIESAIHLPVLIESQHKKYEGVELIGVEPSWWHTAWRNLIDTPITEWQGEVIVLSRTLAQRLGVQKGDKVIMAWLADPPRLRVLRVHALYQANLDEVDRHVAFVPLPLVQKLLGWQADQVEIGHLFLQTPLDSDSLADALSWQLPYTYELAPIEVIFSDIFDWLSLLQQNVQLILGIVILLSFFSVASGFLVLQLVQRLRYELCWVLGATAGQLWQLTLWQAVGALGIGMSIGIGVASLLLWGQDAFQWVKLDPENYVLTEIPIRWQPDPYLYVLGVGAMIAVILGVLAYPWRRKVRLLSHAE